MTISTPASKRKLKAIKINRLQELPLRLGFPLQKLKEISDELPRHYRRGERKIGTKIRLIFSAGELLKSVHKRIEQKLLDRYAIPEELQGGIKGRSTRSNASKHIGKRFVARFDISKFFPSVSSGRVYDLFRELGCEPHSARLLARLTTAEGQLPQGFSTSPKIAALILLRMNERVGALMEKYRLTHSLWVDDLVISGNQPLDKLKPIIEKIIQEEGFKLNTDKTSIVPNTQRQIVTGAVVNTKVGVSKEKVRQMRRTLYLITKIGIEQYGLKYYPELTLEKVKYKVSGNIGHLVSLNPERYKKLQEQWRALQPKD